MNYYGCTCGHGYYDHAQAVVYTNPRGRCSGCRCDQFERAAPVEIDTAKYYGLPLDLLLRVLE